MDADCRLPETAFPPSSLGVTTWSSCPVLPGVMATAHAYRNADLPLPSKGGVSTNAPDQPDLPDQEPKTEEEPEVGQVFLKIGTQEIRRGFRNLKTLNSDATQYVEIENSRLTVGAPEYRGRVEVWAGSRQALGWVTSTKASPTGFTALDLRTGVVLNETRISIVSDNVPPPELVWDMSRLAGLAESQLDISGFDPTVEEFDLHMPIRGIATDQSRLSIGPVKILQPDPKIAGLLDFVTRQKAPAAEAFASAPAFATVRVSARTLLEADRTGVRLIESALDRIALASQYSLAYSPEGALPVFNRDNLFGDPRADPLVLAIGSVTGRRWLRYLTERVPRERPVRRGDPRMATSRPDHGPYCCGDGSLGGDRVLCR